MKIAKTILTLFKEAGQAFGQDKASMLAAALAYYTIFSLAPLLVFSVFVAGMLFGERAVAGQLVEQIEGTVGREAAVVIQNILRNASAGSTGFWATIVSTALLVFGASGVFSQLQQALNHIWGVVPEKASGVAGVVKMVTQRAWTFLMVLLIGGLLLAALALTAVVQALDQYIISLLPAAAFLIPLLNLAVAPFVMWLAFSFMFKVLPQTSVRWRDVWLGSAVTMLLFAVGVSLIGFYLGFNTASSVYGAASSLIVVLLWIYYSAQIFLFGAEFTKVFAQHRQQAREQATAVITRPDSMVPRVVAETAVSLTFPSPSDPQATTRKQLAAGLVGLGTGLLVAIVGYWRRADGE